MQELTLNRELQKSDSEDEVLELQRTLIGWGSKEMPMILDGVFGPATKNAVKFFQLAHALEPDGVVDEDTLSAINGEIAAHPFNLKDYKCKCGECRSVVL